MRGSKLRIKGRVDGHVPCRISSTGKTQKARSWALRKAFELVKFRAASEPLGATVEFDWTMPVQQILVNGEPAFIQPKECLRGKFVRLVLNR